MPISNGTPAASQTAGGAGTSFKDVACINQSTCDAVGSVTGATGTIETLALGSPWMRVSPPAVRRIDGLGPAVLIAQNVLNRNPNSTVATSVGLHPFFRILYARFSEVSCRRCATPVRAVSREHRLAMAGFRQQHLGLLRLP